MHVDRRGPSRPGRRRVLPAICVLLGLMLAAGADRAWEPASAQVFRGPQGRVENVSFEAAGGGVINVYYDLISDSPTATFSVTLQASEDGGQTFTLTPSAISGDVTNVTPGRRKKIVWQSGQDVAVLPGNNLLKFNVIATAGDLKPAGAADAAQPGGAAAAGGANNKMKIILPAAGGAAAAAVILAKKGGSSPPPPACTYSVSPTSVDAAIGGDTKTVTLTGSPSGCSGAWSATSSDPFVTISPSSGNGSGTVTLTITANTGNARSATVTIAGQAVAVTQNGKCTAINASPSPVTPANTGGVQTVSITLTPGGCSPNTWSVAATTNPNNFITAITPTSGSGDGTFAFTASANTTGSTRNGTLAINNPNSGTPNATLALPVSQPATPACTYTVTVNPAHVALTGGSATVSVVTQSGCQWKGSFNPNPTNAGVPMLKFNNMSTDGGATATGTGSNTNLMVNVSSATATRTGTVIITDVATNSVKGSVSITQP